MVKCVVLHHGYAKSLYGAAIEEELRKVNCQAVDTVAELGATLPAHILF